MRGPDEGRNGITEAEMKFAMCAIPDGILERWAEGPWPEPLCGVCRGIWGYEDSFGGENCYDETELHNTQLIIDWHDEPLRVQDRRTLWKANKACYERCLAIYEEARNVLSARAARAA